MLLARNTGQGFIDVSRESGSVFQEPWANRGMAIADIDGDIDNDGRLDAVVTENGGPLHILRNETDTQNHWLTLNLVGHRSNRDAIGAAVKIITAQGEQHATVTTCGSYLSSGDKRVHFGLGRQATVKEIDIRWPSGVIQTLHAVTIKFCALTSLRNEPRRPLSVLKVLTKLAGKIYLTTSLNQPKGVYVHCIRLARSQREHRCADDPRNIEFP